MGDEGKNLFVAPILFENIKSEELYDTVHEQS